MNITNADMLIYTGRRSWIKKNRPELIWDKYQHGFGYQVEAWAENKELN